MMRRFLRVKLALVSALGLMVVVPIWRRCGPAMMRRFLKLALYPTLGLMIVVPMGCHRGLMAGLGMGGR